MRSNVHELSHIARFCRARTKDYFRFDPFLHLRFDRDPRKNREIQGERLSPEEIVALEMADHQRVGALLKKYDRVVCGEFVPLKTDRVFSCGAGEGSFDVSSTGLIRPVHFSYWVAD